MANFKDYQDALNSRNMNCPFNYEEEWKKADEKLQKIVNELMKNHDVRMAHEIADEIYSLSEILSETNEEESRKELEDIIANDMELLKNNGFEDLAAKIEENI